MNRYALLGKIISLDMSVPEFARKVSIPKSSFYRKLNGKSEFTESEIKSIIEYLNLDYDTAFSIFFRREVS
ncbi:MAG: XRE family transcriptional regulator [Clostridiales bacterium]|jgi:predicted transcriptional regulator|nr:XRE family transcriptional regulator [Clostridiales bacterium]